MYSIFHSSLVNTRKCRFCIDRVQSSVNHKSIVRTKLQSNQGCNGILTIHKFHSVHNLNCKQLENNHVQSNDGRKHKIQSRGRNDRDRNNLANICRLVGREPRSLLLAIRLCRSIGRKHNFRDRNMMDLGNQLLKDK
jgi:hypothetical protein